MNEIILTNTKARTVNAVLAFVFTSILSEIIIKIKDTFCNFTNYCQTLERI